MTIHAIAILASLWAQAPGESDRYAPQLRPAHKAPPAEIEDAPVDDVPLEDAPAMQIRHEDQPDDRRGAPDEEAGAPRRTVADDPEADDRMTPVDGHAKQRLRPPELLAEALETLRTGALVGTALTLEHAIAGSTDRAHQLRITQAYWRLCTAQADYYWARNQRDLLGNYTQAQTNQPGMLSARASARADVRDAQLAVAQAQQELSDLIGARAELSPPLASDRPHVGDYNTHYNSIFTNRVPPPRIRLINRTLPVRRKAIDAHAEAIVAALDALESTAEDLRQHGQGLATVLAVLEQLKHERRAFSTGVRAYNQEIAEYAFAVAPPGTNGETLVSMLIKTTPPSRDALRNRSGSRQPSRNERTGFVSAPATDDSQGDDREQQTNYPQDTPDDETGVYQGLLEVDGALRVQKLANLLHWDRNLPPDGSEPTTLAECLHGAMGDRRLAVIGAFWRAREQAARYQAQSDQVEQLGALSSVAIDLRHHPALGVRLQAARRGARAALVDAQAQLLAAEFELTEAAGRRLDDPWLLPSTPPQSGRYIVSGGSRFARPSPADKFGQLVLLQHDKLKERADSVIQSDVNRAAMVSETHRAEPAAESANADEPMPLDVALRAVARQNHETLAFLRDLTEYNMAIARFALAAWPETISNDMLVKKLVIARSTRRDS